MAIDMKPQLPPKPGQTISERLKALKALNPSGPEESRLRALRHRTVHAPGYEELMLVARRFALSPKTEEQEVIRELLRIVTTLLAATNKPGYPPCDCGNPPMGDTFVHEPGCASSATYDDHVRRSQEGGYDMAEQRTVLRALVTAVDAAAVHLSAGPHLYPEIGAAMAPARRLLGILGDQAPVPEARLPDSFDDDIPF